MMKGRKVSQDDEKELAQMFPELYRLAKVVAAMEKIKEDQEERKISEENARQREEENTPKDYSVPQAGDYPTCKCRNGWWGIADKLCKRSNSSDL